MRLLRGRNVRLDTIPRFYGRMEFVEELWCFANALIHPILYT